jgi:hypothetical protein
VSNPPPAGLRLCPACGKPVVPTDRFCVNCGTALPDPVPYADVIADQKPKVPWRAWEAIIVYLISLVIAAPITFVIAIKTDRNAAIAWSAAVAELVLFLSVLGWVKVRHGAGLRDLGWRSSRPVKDVWWGLGAGTLGLVLQLILLPIVIGIAREITGHDVKAPKQIPIEHPSAAILILLGLTVIVLAPMAEEIFFRGFLYQAWAKWMSGGAAAAWSAVVFAVAHISPLLYVPIGVLGFLLARVFARRDSLLPNVVAHGLFNTIGFIFIALSLR